MTMYKMMRISSNIIQNQIHNILKDELNDSDNFSPGKQCAGKELVESVCGPRPQAPPGAFRSPSHVSDVTRRLTTCRERERETPGTESIFFDKR